MIVWGGANSTSYVLGNAGAYDPGEVGPGAEETAAGSDLATAQVTVVRQPSNMANQAPAATGSVAAERNAALQSGGGLSSAVTAAKAQPQRSRKRR